MDCAKFAAQQVEVSIRRQDFGVSMSSEGSGRLL